MPCIRCGKCCITATLDLGEPIEDEKELGRYLAYHFCQPMEYKNNGKPVLAVSIPLVCMHLKHDNGKYYCDIYETRPIVCKEYLCSKAKE